MDDSIKSLAQKIPLLTVNAGPRDGAQWVARLKEEYTAIIRYVQLNREAGDDWFTLEATDKLGTRWVGRCWYMHQFAKYEYRLEFEIPATYPHTAPELVLPELDGKTPKMYHGGKICLSAHFKPLWAKNVPHFGIAHALIFGLAPWLAAEIPHLVETGMLAKK
jgi:ufm1-conjugating enzyme 1